MSANVGEIERRLRSIEQRLERAGGRAAASAAQTADHVAESIASALSGIADRFRGGATSRHHRPHGQSAAQTLEFRGLTVRFRRPAVNSAERGKRTLN